MKIELIVCFSFFTLIFISCRKNSPIAGLKKDCEFKDQICDSSLFNLGNKTNDSIFFSFGSNFYTDTLAPGEVRVFKMGKVKVTYDKGSCEKNRHSWSTPSIISNKGNWFFQQDHCNKVSNFKYIDSSKVIIRLFDETVN